MYARVVRFTDVDPDHLAGRLDGIEAAGPPVDIPAKGIQILHDEDQRTAVVIQLFETADDMAAAEGPLGEMDPGTRQGRAPRSTAARSRPSWARDKAAPRPAKHLRLPALSVALRDKGHLSPAAPVSRVATGVGGARLERATSCL